MEINNTMKIKLEFDSEEEAKEYLDGPKTSQFIRDFAGWIRAWKKYGQAEGTDKEPDNETIEKVSELFYNFLNENNINLD